METIMIIPQFSELTNLDGPSTGDSPATPNFPEGQHPVWFRNLSERKYTKPDDVVGLRGQLWFDVLCCPWPSVQIIVCNMPGDEH
jgi:hypothetical protein